MWGLRKQGLKCTDCGTNVHKKCQEHVRDHPNRPLRVLVQYSYSVPDTVKCLVYSTRTAYPTRLNASYTILVQRDTDTCHVRDWLGRTPLPHGHSYHHRARASRSSLTTRLIVLPACLLRCCCCCCVMLRSGSAFVWCGPSNAGAATCRAWPHRIIIARCSRRDPEGCKQVRAKCTPPHLRAYTPAGDRRPVSKLTRF